ncbi:MAG: hypothetical protein ABJD07_03360 [Gemmatimonadaceae bacterium]
MLLGVAVGTVVTLLFRTGPRGRRPAMAAMLAAGDGARRAAPYAKQGLAWAGKRGAEGARWARDRGEEMWDRVPADEMLGEVGDYLANARDAIETAVSDELKDLRKSVKRRRKSLGI